MSTQWCMRCGCRTGAADAGHLPVCRCAEGTSADGRIAGADPFYAADPFHATEFHATEYFAGPLPPVPPADDRGFFELYDAASVSDTQRLPAISGRVIQAEALEVPGAPMPGTGADTPSAGTALLPFPGGAVLPYAVAHAPAPATTTAATAAAASGNGTRRRARQTRRRIVAGAVGASAALTLGAGVAFGMPWWLGQNDDDMDRALPQPASSVPDIAPDTDPASPDASPSPDGSGASERKGGRSSERPSRSRDGAPRSTAGEAPRGDAASKAPRAPTRESGSVSEGDRDDRDRPPAGDRGPSGHSGSERPGGGDDSPGDQDDAGGHEHGHEHGHNTRPGSGTSGDSWPDNGIPDDSGWPSQDAGSEDPFDELLDILGLRSSRTTPAAAPAPTIGAASTDGVLSSGDSGPAVADLQNRLRRVPVGYTPQSGSYDALTRSSVGTFQTWYGVTGDDLGVYGTNTRRALERATASA
jgi:hypothetical protein